MKNFKLFLEDQVGTSDIAPGFGKISPSHSFRNLPCFELEDSSEYHSFCKGKKTHTRWKKHTKSESIRQWANENPGKDFFVMHSGSFTKITRKK